MMIKYQSRKQKSSSSVIETVDTFESMTDLLNSIPPRDNYSFYIDRTYQSSINVIAPHGGCIEPCTEQIAVTIGKDMLDCFVFSGKKKKDCFKTLHVTSTHYDEPQCMQMVRECEVSLAIHGCDGQEPFIEVGGGNKKLASNLRSYLTDCGYPAITASKNKTGEDENNFINYSRQKGIQLELSVGFRRMLFPAFPKSIQRDVREFPKFVGTIRTWLSRTEQLLASD